MGMDGHEWPYLVKNNMFGWEKALTLQPGMVFSDEPGIYIQGEFGVRLEDDMHITENGAELFTPQSPSIEQPFGIGMKRVCDPESRRVSRVLCDLRTRRP